MRLIALFRLTIALIALAGMGCATGATTIDMVPKSYEVAHRNPYGVRVSTGGGRETQAWSKSEISNENFSAALADSLSTSGVFSSVVRDGTSDYLLDVFLTKVDQPIIGLDMTVLVTANWTLTDLKTNAVVFQDLIQGSHTSTVGDAFAAVKRLRLATEGAARANIAEGIKRMSQLELSPGNNAAIANPK